MNARARRRIGWLGACGSAALLSLSGCFLRPTPKTHAASAAAAPSEDPTERSRAIAAALTRLFSAPQVSSSWFTTEFTTEVPAADIAKIVADAKSDFGDFHSVTGESDHFVILFERGSLNAFARLEQGDRFAVLVLKPSLVIPKTLEQSLAPLHDLGGSVSAMVMTNGVERGSVNPDLPLAVSSSFHLPILAALRDHVEANTQSWRDVVDVKPEPVFSHPFLSGWPDAPFTLYSLTALMMSKNDDVASDAILQVIGRAAAEAYAPKISHF